MENEKQVNVRTKTLKKQTVLWIVLFVAVSLLCVAFIVCYFVRANESKMYGTSLEKIYRKSYYDMVDSVSTSQINLSKVLASNEGEYQQKLLRDTKSSVKFAETNASYLPLTIGSVSETISFLNKTYGYITTLEQKTSAGGTLTDSEVATLKEIYNAMSEIKTNLEAMTSKLKDGYNILSKSSLNKKGENDFSLNLKQIKSDDVTYPTMIYDGPFSDSVLNKTIKGLIGDEISKEQAKESLSKFLNEDENSIAYAGTCEGKIVTYNFYSKGDNEGYYQVSQKGGKLIASNSKNLSNEKKYTLEQAEELAGKFAIDSGIEEVEVVWSDVIENDAYINLAPTQNGVVLYPDLVKVKVDLASGKVIGYEASSYYTNHTSRSVDGEKVSADESKNKISKDYNVLSTKLALAPLDYNREVLCHEFKCKKNGDTYYFYYNAQNGNLENILKVVETQDGSLLM